MNNHFFKLLMLFSVLLGTSSAYRHSELEETYEKLDKACITFSELIKSSIRSKYYPREIRITNLSNSDDIVKLGGFQPQITSSQDFSVPDLGIDGCLHVLDMTKLSCYDNSLTQFKDISQTIRRNNETYYCFIKKVDTLYSSIDDTPLALHYCIIGDETEDLLATISIVAENLLIHIEVTNNNFHIHCGCEPEAVFRDIVDCILTTMKGCLFNNTIIN